MVTWFASGTSAETIGLAMAVEAKAARIADLNCILSSVLYFEDLEEIVMVGE